MYVHIYIYIYMYTYKLHTNLLTIISQAKVLHENPETASGVEGLYGLRD